MIKLLKNAAGIAGANLADWGPVAEPLGPVVAKLRGQSLTAEGEPDAGIWECSPGRWRRQIKKAEFTYFIAGRCTFTADDGQKIEISAGDTLYWPANSMGIWDVHETVRKAFILLPD
jgi:uncharacterized cupin superfamily protein